ncbi:hypothetical protein [Candidatus Aalborgicola defluviihabitans]
MATALKFGKYKIKFVGDGEADNFDKTMVVKARPASSPQSVPTRAARAS